MKYFLFQLLHSFIFFTASAQFIFTPKKPIKTIHLAIDEHEGIQLKDSIPFSAIRLIDSRYDTTIIGFWLDSYIALKDSIQPLALQHIINKYYHRLYTPGKDTLLIQLEKLNIQDAVIRDTNFILTAGYVSSKQYIGNNNSYKYYGVVDTLLKEKFNRKTTYSAHRNGKHMNMEFWDYYLLRLCEAMIKGAIVGDDCSVKVANKYFTAEEVKQMGLQKRNKPILTADSLKPGFYRNFTEFVNNDPTFLYENNESLKKLLEVMHYRVGKNVSHEAPDTSYWGYCDGKNLYIRYRYDFYQLEKKDGDFYVAPTLDARRRDLNSAGWDLLIGLAALTTGIATKEGVTFEGFSVIHPPNIPMIVLSVEGNNILGLQLDWDTGKITY